MSLLVLLHDKIFIMVKEEYVRYTYIHIIVNDNFRIGREIITNPRNTDKKKIENFFLDYFLFRFMSLTALFIKMLNHLHRG